MILLSLFSSRDAIFVLDNLLSKRQRSLRGKLRVNESATYRAAVPRLSLTLTVFDASFFAGAEMDWSFLTGADIVWTS